MTFLPLIIEFFLRSKTPKPRNIFLKVLGYFSLIIGLIMGFFLCIQILGVELSSFEIIAILSITMIIVGGTLLIISKRKKKITNTATDIVDVTKDLINNIDLKNLLQNNATKITSIALLAGFILSQFVISDRRRR